MAWTNFDRPTKRLSLPVGVHEHGHPTEKPLALMIWCLKFVGRTTILDPFMGSGTTLVAAIRTGRRAIGIEREPKYFEIACRRVQAEYGRSALFANVTEDATQAELFP